MFVELHKNYLQLKNSTKGSCELKKNSDYFKEKSKDLFSYNVFFLFEIA